MANRCLTCNHHAVSHRTVGRCVGLFELGQGRVGRCDCTAFVEMDEDQQSAMDLMESLVRPRP